MGRVAGIVPVPRDQGKICTRDAEDRSEQGERRRGGRGERAASAAARAGGEST